MLYLKKVNFDDSDKEYLFVRDMPADENGMTNPWHGISKKDFQQIALPAMIDWSLGKNLPDGFVPETFYFLWAGDTIVGQFRIRHHLCESLRSGAGHIGCFIARPYRGLGYGREGLRLTLNEARALIPEDEIFLRVNRDNTPSLRAMLSNGGYIHHEAEQKYYVRIRK